MLRVIVMDAYAGSTRSVFQLLLTSPWRTA